MKKFTFSILLSAICFCINAQVKDTAFTQVKSNGVWVNNGIDIFTSNASCDIVSDLFQGWDPTTETYVNISQGIYSYNQAGDIQKITNQNWDPVNNAWVNSGRNFYSFSPNKLHFTNTAQAWDADNNVWVNSYRISVEYNEDGTQKASEFDISDGINWLPNARTFNTYDAQKRVIEFVYQAYSNNAWVNSSRTVNSYTGNGLSFSYYWDGFNNQWVKSLRGFNRYLDNTALATKQLFQGYTGVSWQNSSRYSVAYNTDNMVTGNNGQLWDAALQSWYDSYRSRSTYYNDGSQHEFLYESWDPNTNTWGIGYRGTYTNNACGTTLEFVPVVQAPGNKEAVLNNNMFGLNNMQKSSNTGMQRQLNMQLSNGKTTVYDFTNGAGNKQFAFRLVSKPMKKPHVSKAEESNNFIQHNKVLISPNPAPGYFTLNLTGYKPQGSVILKLTDVSGRNVLQQKIQAGSVQNINLPHLQKGIYVVSIICGKNSQTQKLMVE